MNKLLVGLLFLSFIFLIVVFDLHLYLSLEYIQLQKENWKEIYRLSPVFVMALYFTSYLLLTAFSIPMTFPLTLLGGFLFGVVLGTLLVSFASTLGSCLAFLVSRYIFQDFVKKRFSTRFEKINSKFEENGLFYLFTLRFAPIVPFVLINILMGLTRISLKDFYWVTQLGMLTLTIVYVNAGSQLRGIQAPADIVSIPLLLSLCLVAFVPWIGKALIHQLRRNRKA